MCLPKSKPLQYNSLKTILHYINANIRFQISVHMPSLQKTEKLVPLKIDKLVLKEYGLSVDGYNYDVVLKRVQKGGPVFLDVVGDLDEYGFRVSLPSRVLTPGDILLSPKGLEEEKMRHEDVWRKSDEARWYIDQDIARIKRRIITQLRHRRLNLYELNKALSRLVPFDNLKHDNTSTYDCYTKLTVSAQNSKKVMYTAKYTSPLFQGIKYLTKRFFKNRDPIHVNHLNFGNWVARLPVGVKFRVQQFKANKMFVLQESLLPILAGSIKNLFLDFFTGTPDDFKSKIIQNASRLTISMTILTGNEVSWYSVLQTLRNKTIILIVGWHENFQTRDFVRLVNQWIEDVREVGTRFEALSKRGTWAQEKFEKLKKEFARCLNNGRIILPMVDQTSILIQYKEIDTGFFSIMMESVKNVDL